MPVSGFSSAPPKKTLHRWRIHADMSQTMHNKYTITLSMRQARDEQYGERESVAECLALHEKLRPGWLSAVDSERIRHITPLLRATN